jgi:hypothetical protein
MSSPGYMSGSVLPGRPGGHGCRFSNKVQHPLDLRTVEALPGDPTTVTQQRQGWSWLWPVLNQVDVLIKSNF